MTKYLFIDDMLVTVQLPDDVQDTLARFFRQVVPEMDAVLARHGLASTDVILPTFERPVLRAEVEPESDVAELLHTMDDHCPRCFGVCGRNTERDDWDDVVDR